MQKIQWKRSSSQEFRLSTLESRLGNTRFNYTTTKVSLAHLNNFIHEFLATNNNASVYPYIFFARHHHSESITKGSKQTSVN